MEKTYIVIANDPKDITDVAFTEGHYPYKEWKIFKGDNALYDAEREGHTLREYFQEVQVRKLGKAGDV
jgi:hypothetical protein